MDARSAHFLVVVGGVCAQARTGRLPVRVTLRDGRELTGVPDAELVDDASSSEIDDTGLGERVLIGDGTVRLEDIVELLLSAPNSQQYP